MTTPWRWLTIDRQLRRVQEAPWTRPGHTASLDHDGGFVLAASLAACSSEPQSSPTPRQRSVTASPQSGAHSPRSRSSTQVDCLRRRVGPRYPDHSRRWARDQRCESGVGRYRGHLGGHRRDQQCCRRCLRQRYRWGGGRRTPRLDRHVGPSADRDQRRSPVRVADRPPSRHH